ncbi:nucleotidyltransferase domain-containing protein [Mycolicibacterium sp. P9-64]|uniref:DNA polymerase beta superfamily protein n=1 Tax=Mycolicibacterium sp. P9-64 TaxID=2024612 RepID=UPI003221FAFD
MLLSEIGSTMHGVSSGDTGDDIDLMGICIEPPLEVLGLGEFEQYEYRDRKVNERSREGDTDLVVYGLRNLVRLAAAGNPTVIMPLFSHPEKHVKYVNEFGMTLRREFPRS